MKQQSESKGKGQMRQAFRRAWWLVLSSLMVCLAWAMVAQRIPKRVPSPADPGMRLSGIPMRTPLKKAFPEPKYEPSPEAPDPTGPIVHDDPNSGEDPDAGDVPDDDDEVPTKSPVDHPGRAADWPSGQLANPGPLTVKGYELTRVARGSAIGTEGDHVLVVRGSGFMQAEMGPIIHFSDSMTITNTHVNARGTEIYAVISPEHATWLDTTSTTVFYVQNPGGYYRMPNRWAKMEYHREQFRDSLKNAQEAKYFRNNFITR